MNWDFIAGFFDGEGCAFIRKDGGVVLVVSNTNREVLEGIKTMIGGTIVTHIRPPPNLILYDLIFRDHRDVLPIVEELVKRCIVKKAKLSEMLQYLEQRKWHRNILPKDIQEIQNQYTIQQKSLKQIAEFYGVTPCSILKKLKRHGIARDWRKEHSNRRRDLVRKLRQEGFSYREIERQTGIDVSTACHYGQKAH